MYGKLYIRSPLPLELGGYHPWPPGYHNMWQFRIEIEHDSIAYFERITDFDKV